jgi:lipid-A-disaccharide synthase
MLFDAAKVSVVGLTEVISHLGDILAASRTLMRRMQEMPPALLILIDFPDFNLLLAAKAKKLGIPVFYYISPQVWAWRKGRTSKIGRLTDRIGVILPFEKEFYARYGVSVDYVGHPLMDSVQRSMPPEDFLAEHNIPAANTIIGLLPGSRAKEICNLLPDFLAAAARLANSLQGNCTFLLPRASTISLQLLQENGLSEFEKLLDIRVISENRYDLMGACSAVVAASGTVTLELAILDVPAVVTYRVSPRTYRIGRLLVRDVKFFSLVNLIGGQRIIPELLQDEVTPEAIADELQQLLVNETERQRVLQGLAEVRKRLGEPGASERAAEIALEIITKRS